MSVGDGVEEGWLYLDPVDGTLFLLWEKPTHGPSIPAERTKNYFWCDTRDGADGEPIRPPGEWWEIKYRRNGVTTWRMNRR